MESSDIQLLLNIRTKLNEEVDRLKDMIARLEEHIEVLDGQIAKTSFTTADAAMTVPRRTETGVPTRPPVRTTEPQSIVIMNKAGKLELGILEVLEQTIRFLPAEGAVYDITRGAFARFFVERILGKFQQEDRHRVENGEIEWEDAFDFEVHAEDNILGEMIIRNYGDENRMKEIQSTLRWALEKTYSAR
ncbi:MAG: hypothetical protein ACFFDV_04070 [Candidatus Thorarchaeota archaeon]